MGTSPFKLHRYAAWSAQNRGEASGIEIGRIPMKLELSALILASAASCGIAFAAESSSGECLPTGAVLAAAATLGAAAGAYRLTMVGGRPG